MRYTPEQRAAIEAFRRTPFRFNRAEKTSVYKHVNWNRKCRRWQLHITAGGKNINIGTYDDEQGAAVIADYARWFLQDFLARRPEYNFPNQLPPIDQIPWRIAVIRAQLIESGVPRFYPYDPRFKPNDIPMDVLQTRKGLPFSRRTFDDRGHRLEPVSVRVDSDLLEPYLEKPDASPSEPTPPPAHIPSAASTPPPAPVPVLKPAAPQPAAPVNRTPHGRCKNCRVPMRQTIDETPARTFCPNGCPDEISK